MKRFDLEKAEYEGKIKKFNEKATRSKIIIALSGVGSFIAVSFLFFFFMLSNVGIDFNISAALSLVAGTFAAFVVMAVSGLIREFSVKTGLIEFTSRLEKDMQNVQVDVTKSKEQIHEIDRKIENFISTKIQTAANSSANANSSPQVHVYNNAQEARELNDQAISIIFEALGYDTEQPSLIKERLSTDANLPQHYKIVLTKLLESNEKLATIQKEKSELSEKEKQRAEVEDNISKADLLLFEKKYKEALDLYTEALNKVGDNFKEKVKILYKKGSLLYLMKKYDEAIDWFDKILEIDPNQSDAWTSKGVILGMLQRYDEELSC